MERAVEAAAELAEVVVGFFMIDFLTEADLGIEPKIGMTYIMCVHFFLTQRFGGPRGRVDMVVMIHNDLLTQ